MTDRIAMKNGLVAAIAAVNQGVPVEPWNGEEAVFNTAHAWPGISVSYAGMEFSESEEIGADQATYDRAHVFRAFTYAMNSSLPGQPSGEDQAMAIMEKAEKGVSGKIIIGQGQAELIGEEQVHTHLGRVLYMQTWKIPVLESHTT